MQWLEETRDMQQFDMAHDIGQGSENKGAMLKDKRQGTGQGVRDKEYSRGDMEQGVGGKRDMP
jgi:hypothetical protein